jgi:hypothetical protein
VGVAGMHFLKRVTAKEKYSKFMAMSPWKTDAIAMVALAIFLPGVL